MKLLSRFLLLSVVCVLMSFFSNTAMAALDKDVGLDEPPTIEQSIWDNLTIEVLQFEDYNPKNLPSMPQNESFKPNMEGVQKSFIVALSYHHSNALSVHDNAPIEAIFIEEQSRFATKKVFDYPLSYGLACMPIIHETDVTKSNTVIDYPLSYGLSDRQA